MRLVIPRAVLWLATLGWGSGVVLLATGAAFPDPLGTGAAETRPVVEAANLAREYRADPAARHKYRMVRVRVRADRTTPEPGRCVWVEQTDGSPDGAAVAEVRVPWRDRGAVRAGGVVVVRVIPRGYADGRADLGIGIPD